MKACLGVLVVGLGSLLTCSPANAQASIFDFGDAIKSQQNRTAARNYRFYDPQTRRYLVYQYGKRLHMDRIAYRLAHDANALCWTAHRNYQGNREFRVTYKEMYNLITGAVHIQKLIKEGYYRKHHDTDHIIKDLHAMDKLVDHIRDDVRYWVRNEMPIDPRAAAPRPGEQESVLVHLARLEDTLHHLMRDYGVSRSRRAITSRPTIGIAPKPR